MCMQIDLPYIVFACQVNAKTQRLLGLEHEQQPRLGSLLYFGQPIKAAQETLC